MARRTQGGFTVELPPGRKIYIVRFRHAGQPVKKSTGQRDPREAQKQAAQIYAEIVSGRQAPALPVSADIERVFAEWLAEYELTHATGTTKTMADYVKYAFVPFFRSLDRLKAPNYTAFMNERMGEVVRSTLRKQLSGLRQFRAWCMQAPRSLNGLDAVPSLAKLGHPGQRADNARKRKATILTPEEVARILMALPDRSPFSGALVRPFCVVVWETGLRPFSTIAKLEAPLHWYPGKEKLFVSREIDKTHNERDLPVSAEAREALDRACPKKGLLFPIPDDGLDEERREKRHERHLSNLLRVAVAKAGIVKSVSLYDLRHSRLSLWANGGGPLPGVSFLAGHRHLSTTALYVQGNEQAASEVLGLAADRRAASRRRGHEGPRRGGGK